MPRLEFDCRLVYPSGFALECAFDAADGVTTLVGPSGSGKTTILRLIAGLLRPQRGRIRLEETVLVDTARGVCLPPERRRVGVVFQDYLLFPHLTVEGNLRFGWRRSRTALLPAASASADGAPAGADGAAAARDPAFFRRVVETLDLAELLSRRPASLSGGQQQRVALARAVLSRPRLLLLDEPVNAQHAELKSRLLRHVQQIVCEFGIPALLVSHDLEQIAGVASASVTITQGRRA